MREFREPLLNVITFPTTTLVKFQKMCASLLCQPPPFLSGFVECLADEFLWHGAAVALGL
jgi:hypothetical protein